VGVIGGTSWQNQIDKLFERHEGSWLFLVRNRAYIPFYVEYLRARGIKHQIGNSPGIEEARIKAIDGYVGLQRGRGEISKKQAKALIEHYPEIDSAGVWGAAKDAPVFTADLLRRYGVHITDLDWFEVLEMPSEDLLFIRRLAAQGRLHDDPLCRVDTIHGVKGSEADNVVVYDGMSPRVLAAYEIDAQDEHRAAYVAATRARNNLFIHLSDTAKRAFPYHEYFSRS